MVTLLILIITAAISITAFNQRNIFHKYLFNSYQVYHRKEYVRLISHGFLHANWEHLIINMFVFYSFGRQLEVFFRYYFGGKGIILFIILYLSSIVISSTYSLFKHKDNFTYNAVGASGAVSAVTFACIFFAPLDKVLFFAIIPLPGFVFGILYLVYSWYMAKRNIDNVGHDSHFYGAVYGFFFPLLFNPSLIKVFFSAFFE